MCSLVFYKKFLGLELSFFFKFQRLYSGRIGRLGWLAHMVTCFACNTSVIIDASSNLPVQFAVSNCCNKNPESNNQVNKICDSHLTCKVANKCLNVHERVEVVEWNKMVPSLPLLSCELSVSMKENPDRKKNNNNKDSRTTSRQWRCTYVFIINFEHISHFFLVIILLPLNK